MRLISALTAASTFAIGVAALSTPAFAQSTGSIDFEEKEIVVTGSRTSTQAVGGISAPDTAKAKAVITAENIQRQNPGQTILDTINQVPGVSFQNNDAYGSSGGTLNIRGFSSDRVSLTFDGIPLNDSGNYAVYSNQQIDPELIEQVNVNLGTTDVDSPTASAAGGTVNYRTIVPSHDVGMLISGSYGQFDFMRFFVKAETGDLTESGLRGFVSVSTATNDNPFNNYGKVNKQQYNAKLYQPLSGTDFISVSAHYNRNRNNFFGSLPLRLDAGRTVGSGNGNRFPANADERKYNISYPCQVDAAQPGVQDLTNTCGTEFDRRYNPSDTGNLRLSSKFTLADGLVLTVDPSFQYVKANGGGTVTGREGRRTIGGIQYTGFIGGNYYFGSDINGDGDTLDTCRNAATAGSACSSTASASNAPFGGVTLIAPSQTQTHRIGVITGLRWDLDENNTVRVGYTYDRARHRQTGELGTLQTNGEPSDVFSVNNPLSTGGGFIMQKRDRLSYAILHQLSAEYRGEFMDGALDVTAGLRAPFFKRNLTNYCFTTSASGFIDCIGYDAATLASYTAANPYSYDSATNTVTGYATPQQRTFKYNKLLPNVGFVYHITDSASIFANASQGLSVPGTDNLYNSFYYPVGTVNANPRPETTDNFDLGVRYRSGMLQAQLSGFYNQFHNRLASAYDPDLNQTVYRNLGDVKKYGIDGSIAFQPIDAITFYVFGSLMKSEIKDDVVIAENGDGTTIYAPTAGKRESGAPKYTFGGTMNAKLGPIELGITAKRTGERYIFDTNEAMYTGTFIPSAAKACTATPVPVCSTPAPIATAPTKIYEATAAAYWLVNLDARFNLSAIGLNDKSYIQLNVYNLFDQFYVGGFGGGLNQSQSFTKTTGVMSYGSPPFVQIGAPRTVSATVVMGF